MKKQESQRFLIDVCVAELFKLYEKLVQKS